MKISATRSSSRIATRVSWAVEEMIISLVMPEAPSWHRSWRGTDRGRPHQQVRQQHPAQRHYHYSRLVGGGHRARLIGKSTHPYVENQAEPRQRGNHGGAAIAHERKRQSLDRRKAGR